MPFVPRGCFWAATGATRKNRPTSLSNSLEVFYPFLKQSSASSSLRRRTDRGWLLLLIYWKGEKITWKSVFQYKLRHMLVEDSKQLTWFPGMENAGSLQQMLVGNARDLLWSWPKNFNFRLSWTFFFPQTKNLCLKNRSVVKIEITTKI